MKTELSSELVFPAVSVPRRVRRTLLITLGAGLVAFIIGIFGDEHQRAWQIYFVNFLFWSGIAQGGVVMAAVYRITNAKWGDPFRRIGEAMVAFLPVSLLLFAVLIVWGNGLFPWVSAAFEGREIWLSPLFVFLRDGLALLVLLWVSFRFVYWSVRPEAGIIPVSGGPSFARSVLRWLTRGWTDTAIESDRSSRRLARLTPVLLLLFAVLYSLLGFDLVMSMDPHWVSTIFGWMFFLHAFYAALVAITILAVISRSWLNTTEAFATHQWHDMGRFVFGFCLLSGGFFWSQYLVIWYGNLPEETSFLIRRFYSDPWEPLMWVYIIGAYLFPLAVFLSKRVKEIPLSLLCISSVILVSLYLERFIAVVPFVWKVDTIPFGLLELLVTAGFAALFLLSWLTFVRVLPVNLVVERTARFTQAH